LSRQLPANDVTFYDPAANDAAMLADLGDGEQPAYNEQTEWDAWVEHCNEICARAEASRNAAWQGIDQDPDAFGVDVPGEWRSPVEVSQ
jgi:hypothetical protein